MKKETLKVGQSFEVVEVLKNWGYHNLTGLHCIISYTGFVKRTTGDFNLQPNNGYFLLRSHELKSIGKLTITKLK